MNISRSSRLRRCPYNYTDFRGFVFRRFTVHVRTDVHMHTLTLLLSIFVLLPVGREQGDCPRHLKIKLSRSSYLRGMVQKVGGSHWEDLQQVTAAEVRLGHRYGWWGLRILSTCCGYFRPTFVTINNYHWGGAMLWMWFLIIILSSLQSLHTNCT